MRTSEDEQSWDSTAAYQAGIDIYVKKVWVGLSEEKYFVC
jgi:hypothetical protein